VVGMNIHSAIRIGNLSDVVARRVAFRIAGVRQQFVLHNEVCCVNPLHGRFVIVSLPSSSCCLVPFSEFEGISYMS
jgi:hypothetical protein